MKATLKNIKIGTTIVNRDGEKHTILGKANGRYLTNRFVNNGWEPWYISFLDIESGNWNIVGEMLTLVSDEPNGKTYELNGSFEQYLNGVESIDFENKNVIFFLGDVKIFTSDSEQSGNQVYAYGEKGDDYFTVHIREWYMKDFIDESVEFALEEIAGQREYEQMVESMWRTR